MPNKKGFTLLEIIVVSLIVGVLVLIAIPNFTNMLNRSYARQALTNLLAIYSAQQSYYMNNNSAYC
ncbi:MAG: prepilin-type N-terminal cleavage/methylation domain-containing protein, partial [Candidatus Omnitrophota bacterium]